MENEKSDRTITWYLRSYFSVLLAVLAILNVWVRQSPSAVNLEYHWISAVYSIVAVPAIGTLVLAVAAFFLAKSRLSKFVSAFACLAGLVSIGYMVFFAAPLQRSAGNGDFESVKKNLSWGTNINVKDEQGYTPLHKAAQRGDTAMVNYLIDKGANVNARSGARNTPLILAASGGSVECCELLMKKGALINVTGLFGSTRHTAFQWAARAGQLEVVKFFLENGVGPDEKEGTMTALLHACEHGHLDVVKTLLDAGASIKSPVGDRREKTILELAKNPVMKN